MTSPAPPNLVRHYPGRCFTFNVVQVKRIKKAKNTRQDGEEERVSEEWKNDDENRILILRLLQSSSHPWILIHHGIFEILKGPLVLFVNNEDQDGTTVNLTVRDHSNRGLSCIRRKFYFEFHNKTDAAIFVFAHNQLLLDHSRGKKAIMSKPATKKRKRSDEDDDSVETKRTVTDKDKKKMMDIFEKGDEHTIRDDNHAETQNPWSDDDSDLL